jgi:hypothetical protein
MNTATVTWPGPGVVQPAIQRPTAMRLAETEYQRVIDVVNALQFEDWTRPHRLHRVGCTPAGRTHRRQRETPLEPL